MDKVTIEVEINAQMHAALRECRAALGHLHEGVELPHAVRMVAAENARLLEALARAHEQAAIHSSAYRRSGKDETERLLLGLPNVKTSETAGT